MVERRGRRCAYSDNLVTGPTPRSAAPQSGVGQQRRVGQSTTGEAHCSLRKWTLTRGSRHTAQRAGHRRELRRGRLALCGKDGTSTFLLPALGGQSRGSLPRTMQSRNEPQHREHAPRSPEREPLFFPAGPGEASRARCRAIVQERQGSRGNNSTSHCSASSASARRRRIAGSEPAYRIQPSSCVLITRRASSTPSEVLG